MVVLIVRQEVLVDQVEETPIQVELIQLDQLQPNQHRVNLAFPQDIINTVIGEVAILALLMVEVDQVVRDQVELHKVEVQLNPGLDLLARYLFLLQCLQVGRMRLDQLVSMLVEDVDHLVPHQQKVEVVQDRVELPRIILVVVDVEVILLLVVPRVLLLSDI